jgi:hypothetical protein
MKLVNNTPGQVSFSITSPGHGDCGEIDAGGTSDWPKYDNQGSVRVSFATMPPSKPPQITPYKITIPKPHPGMTVTIGVFKQ